jgi:bifunctional ADP-heptose synthase (sugar kinase/adenylyltransferase)
MAVLLGAGLTLQQALPWANRAGGVVVGKFGTATVTLKELTA